MWRLFIQIISGIFGFLVASKIVHNVAFTGTIFFIPSSEADVDNIFRTLIFIGFFWGILNFFVKPVLKLITLPLRILTLNLFSLVIAMGLVWATDIISPELTIIGIIPLFLTTLILWGISTLLGWWLPQK
ncbi:MAG: phage holin family protein [bacterium]